MSAQPLQGGLFDPPIARRTDPASSKEAAAAITASGARTDQRSQCLAAVKEHPGKTSLELADLTGICRYVLARRLSELQQLRQVHKGALVRCAASGRLGCAWWLGPDPLQPPPAAVAA